MGMTGASGAEYLPYRSYYVSDETPHFNRRREVSEQGKIITKADGSAYVNKDLYAAYKFIGGGDIDYLDAGAGVLSIDGTFHNANLPFGGMQRFRKKYTLEMRSLMAMADLSYQFPNKRGKIAFAAAYIDGDAYPFNEEKDKTYSGFMPLRDANYVGRNVTSFVMLYPRKVPRPTTMADTTLLSNNNYKTMQNLAYVGFCIAGYPGVRKDEFMVELNALSFWEVSPPQKWDTTASRAITDTSTIGSIGKETSIYKYLQTKKLNFSGHYLNEDAARHLGFEVNGVFKWRPVSYLDFDFRFGVFLPGQLYRDVEGMPNINTVRVDKDGDLRYDSLGDKMISGGMARVTYKF
jgi:hypothetical protein